MSLARRALMIGVALATGACTTYGVDVLSRSYLCLARHAGAHQEMKR